MRKIPVLKYEFEISEIKRLIDLNNNVDIFSIGGKMYSIQSLQEPLNDPLIKGLAFTIIKESLGLVEKFRIGISEKGDFFYVPLSMPSLN